MNRCIGFDADFTLISYNYIAFARHQFSCLGKTLMRMGIPDIILTEEFTGPIARYIESGLIADLSTGWVLKLDSSYTVLKAFHGFSEVSKEALLSEYQNLKFSLEKLESFSKPGCWHAFISHYAYGMAYMFIVLTEIRKRGIIQMTPSAIINLMKEAVSMSFHTSSTRAKGSLEFYEHIFANPEIYFKKASEETKNMLSLLKNNNNKLVLVSNSQQEYVECAFDYCYGENWRELFDLIVFNPRKPSFFTTHREFVETEVSSEVRHGCAQELQRLIQSSEYIFVGDNYISDIWGAKYAGWTTVLVEEYLDFEQDENSLHEFQYATAWGSHFFIDGKPTLWQEFTQEYANHIVGNIEDALKVLLDKTQ